MTLLSNPMTTQALLAGFGLAVTTGPLGCFLIWRRMAFFGDALAHTALLGVALGMVLHLNLTGGIVGVCLLCGLILARAQRSPTLSADAWLGIISYGALALGILALSISGSPLDPESYLFGDILTLIPQDLYWIYGCALGTGVFLVWKWRALLLLTLDEELAQTAGVCVERIRALFMVILALAVAIALKAVGALLVPALMIMPAATAGRFARSPVRMVFWAVGIALVAICGGLSASLLFDTPSGATIVAVCLLLFLSASGFEAIRNHWRP